MGIVHLIGISTIFSVFLFICLAATAPLSRSLQPIVTPQMTLLAADGTPIAQSGSDYAEPVMVHDLPPHVIDAVLAIEDRRFYDHFGMDPKGVARAAWRNMSSGSTEGGSTITQQLAKFTYLTPERSLARKAHELLIAFWLETWLTKDEILERYLSNAYFGDNNYGLRSASRNYFGKQPEELSLSESAMLAGLLKAPSALAPTQHWDKSVARMNVVLEAMVQAGYIDADTVASVAPPRLAATSGTRLPSGTHFTDWALADYDKSALAQPRVTLVTTLDSRLQATAENLIAGADLGEAEAALVAMRRNGEVVAMVGGRDYSRSRFNRVTMAERQIGSTFKTFVYLAALENGVKPDDPISNRPIKTGDYRPQNHDDSYSDFLTVEKAFAQSSNVASVRLYRAVGGAKVQQVAHKLGLKADYDPELPSVALGTPSVSLMDLTAAYAGIAANRYPVEPTGFRRSPPDLWDRIVEPRKAFSKKTHRDIQRLLATSIEQGTGRGAKLPLKAYGKTGTTQGSRDSLFVGYASDLVVGVWVGHDDNRPNPGFSGGGVPARIWKDFMMEAHHLSGDRSTRPAARVAASAVAARIPDGRQMATRSLAQAAERPQIGR
ncbi:penicillin-binding protein [Alteriqipengyuania lutimaris]|uniref:Penicillin-binding protein n=2 Tax=Alteriqipengyuania lutimaris TaxID=1538146 RepID=A0A395LPG6_9SPHN|nr:penicillin-binding protein [Alteriqipengyuania lutimaris]